MSRKVRGRKDLARRSPGLSKSRSVQNHMSTPTVRPPSEPVSLPEPKGPLSWLGITRARLLWEVKPAVPPRRPRRSAPKSPLWVRAFTAGGRPMVAVIVMVMCAPGEHHLAVLAGWDSRLAWGMAAVLAAYAGIAAAVAGERRKGDPGH